MNFLPFIYFLLISIAILNYGFFEKHGSFKQTYLSIIHQYQKQQKIFGEDQEKKFNKKTKTKGKKTAKTARKINFYPLFNEGKKTQKELFAIFVRLLETLLQDRININQNAETLADGILNAFKTNPTTSLETLKLENDNMQHAFYQILKEKRSLGDFATFSSKASVKRILFNNAPKEILTALFGEKISKALIANKHYIKNEETLKTILLSFGLSDNYSISLLFFEKPAK
jgi:hypothetical protein